MRPNKLAIMIISTTKIIFNYIRGIFWDKATSICRIEEINLEKKTIIIHCRGISSPIKLSLEEAIYDSMLLSNLSPKHASWIGYYYGKCYRDSINDKKNYNNFVDFLINDESNKFEIKMIDRQGNVIYSRDGNFYTVQPIKALNDESIISNFTSIQACYIGILAGTSTRKIIASRVSNTKQVHLKIVR